MERKYSLAEIDRMRELIHELEFSGGGGGGYGSSSNPEMDLVFLHRRLAIAASVEDSLRTYMMAGIGPDELEKYVAEKASTQ